VKAEVEAAEDPATGFNQASAKRKLTKARAKNRFTQMRTALASLDS